MHVFLHRLLVPGHIQQRYELGRGNERETWKVLWEVLAKETSAFRVLPCHIGPQPPLDTS